MGAVAGTVLLAVLVAMVAIVVAVVMREKCQQVLSKSTQPASRGEQGKSCIYKLSRVSV